MNNEKATFNFSKYSFKKVIRDCHQNFVQCDLYLFLTFTTTVTQVKANFLVYLDVNNERKSRV